MIDWPFLTKDCKNNPLPTVTPERRSKDETQPSMRLSHMNRQVYLVISVEMDEPDRLAEYTYTGGDNRNLPMI